MELDGGFRFKLFIEGKSTGHIEVSFHHESDASFPGKLLLDGHFPIAGEYGDQVIGAFIKLLTEGRELSL